MNPNQQRAKLKDEFCKRVIEGALRGRKTNLDELSLDELIKVKERFEKALGGSQKGLKSGFSNAEDSLLSSAYMTQERVNPGNALRVAMGVTCLAALSTAAVLTGGGATIFSPAVVGSLGAGGGFLAGFAATGEFNHDANDFNRCRAFFINKVLYDRKADFSSSEMTIKGEGIQGCITNKEGTRIREIIIDGKTYKNVPLFLPREKFEAEAKKVENIIGRDPFKLQDMIHSESFEDKVKMVKSFLDARIHEAGVKQNAPKNNEMVDAIFDNSGAPYQPIHTSLRKSFAKSVASGLVDYASTPGFLDGTRLQIRASFEEGIKTENRQSLTDTGLISKGASYLMTAKSILHLFVGLNKGSSVHLIDSGLQSKFAEEYHQDHIKTKNENICRAHLLNRDLEKARNEGTLERLELNKAGTHVKSAIISGKEYKNFEYLLNDQKKKSDYAFRADEILSGAVNNYMSKIESELSRIRQHERPDPEIRERRIRERDTGPVYTAYV